MAAFRIMWHRIVTCLRGEVTMAQLEKLLRTKLGGSKALKEDIAHYDRQEGIDGGDRNYDYLLRAMDRHLKHVGQHGHQQAFESQISQQIQQMGAGKKPTMAAINQYLASPAKGGGKGDRKGGGKDRKSKGGGKGGVSIPIIIDRTLLVPQCRKVFAWRRTQMPLP